MTDSEGVPNSGPADPTVAPPADHPGPEYRPAGEQSTASPARTGWRFLADLLAGHGEPAFTAQPTPAGPAADHGERAATTHRVAYRWRGRSG
jgi:hypothetical protein